MAKRALVVGINDYSQNGGGNLSYCVADAESMANVLIHAFGFPEENVIILTDPVGQAVKKATRNNILGALTQLLVNAQPGDAISFYFAGHGGITPQTTSPDNTRYYECLVPSRGEWISDLDIDEILHYSNIDLSQVNFTIILDACHSGGMHNTDIIEQSILRSVPFDPMVMAGIQDVQTWWPIGICLPEGSDQILLNVSNPIIENGRLVDLDEDPDKTLVGSARAMLFAACKYYETAGEHASIQHGFFTKAFLNIINGSNFRVSNNDMMNQLRSQVATLSSNSQTPQLRGQLNRVNQHFLAEWNSSI